MNRQELLETKAQIDRQLQIMDLESRKLAAIEGGKGPMTQGGGAGYSGGNRAMDAASSRMAAREALFSRVRELQREAETLDALAQSLPINFAENNALADVALWDLINKARR